MKIRIFTQFGSWSHRQLGVGQDHWGREMLSVGAVQAEKPLNVHSLGKTSGIEELRRSGRKRGLGVGFALCEILGEKRIQLQCVNGFERLRNWKN